MWGLWLYPAVAFAVFNIYLGVDPRLIGIALTAKDLEDELLSEESYSIEVPRADITIQFKNYCIIIEVKKSEVDCIMQLNNQMDKAIQSSGLAADDFKREKPQSYSWYKVIELCQSVENYYKTLDSSNLLLKNFLDFNLDLTINWRDGIILSVTSKY